MEHALPQGYIWLSQDARQNTLGQMLWQSGTGRRGAYQDDEFTTRPAALKMKTPETRNRIYWGSHMQHIYIERVQLGQLGHSLQEDLQSSQHRKDTRQDRTRRPNTKTKDRTIAKISVQGERIVGSACGNGVHLKGKALPEIYLQDLDIHEGHAICSVCFGSVGARTRGHVLDAVNAHSKKEHFFFSSHLI